MNTSTFHISREDSIQNVQDKFSSLFPLLTINFYSQNEKSSSDDSCAMFSPESRIRDLNPHCLDGTIKITDGMMVYEMENAIQYIFGLHAEIFRKTGNPGARAISHCLLKDIFHIEKRQIKRYQPVYFRDVPFGC